MERSELVEKVRKEAKKIQRKLVKQFTEQHRSKPNKFQRSQLYVEALNAVNI